ncbi:MAG: glycosyltransferase family 4 protein [Sulfitobacter sp.]|nr:glycosyltransferase family 4 protein [Sulfitobacter sp.]
MAASRPRILLVGGSGIRAGVPRHICQLACILSRDAEVTVLSDPDEGGFADLRNLPVRHLQYPGLATHLSPAHLWQGVRSLREALEKVEADLVWFHARLPILLGRLLLATRLWRPQGAVICTLHGLPFDPGHRQPARHLSLWLEGLLTRTGPPLHLVTLTPAMADHLKKALGPLPLRRHSLHTLENCADLGPLPPRPQTRTGVRNILMTGRAAWQKDLPRAARLLATLPQNFHLTLCGPGTDSPAFCDQIARQVASDDLRRIHLLGPQADIAPLLAQADAYLLTSRYEGLPIGLLEATQAGLPAILAPFEGAREIVNAHPFALLLNNEETGRDAGRVTALLDRYLSDRPAAEDQIRHLWATRWSPAQFEPAVRALVAGVLAPPT